MPLPKRELFAAITRKITEQHDQWDSPHHLFSLLWDGTRISYGAAAMITPDVPPAHYPAIIERFAQEEMDRQQTAGENTLYGYALQIEAHAVVGPGPQATAAEQLRYQADRIGRTFHQRPDAVEVATVMCADIHGRMWQATKRRPQPDEIEEQYTAPSAVKRPHGQMVGAVLDAALLTGILLHKLPRP